MAVLPTLKRIRMSREDFDNLPEGPPFYDYVDGDAIEVNRPSVRHQRVLSKTERALEDFVESGALGVVAREVSLEFANGAIFGPDLLYIDRENDQCRIRERGDVVGVPDLIVEVLSPSTEEYDRHEKMARYHRAGVKWVWLIGQDSLLVEEFQWSDAGYIWILPAADRVFRPRLFPNLEMDLHQLVGDSTDAG